MIQYGNRYMTFTEMSDIKGKGAKSYSKIQDFD